VDLSFSTNDIAICHKRGNGKQPLFVSESAVNAHLAHGDQLAVVYYLINVTEGCGIKDQKCYSCDGSVPEGCTNTLCPDCKVISATCIVEGIPCCGDAECIEGVCNLPCLEQQGICDNTEQCCSGTCDLFYSPPYCRDCIAQSGTCDLDAGFPCCGGLECIEGVCNVPETCLGQFGLCDSTEQCCSGTCDLYYFPPYCRDCIAQSDTCDLVAGFPCCGGLECRDGFCKRPCVDGFCESSDCCQADEFCNLDTAECAACSPGVLDPCRAAEECCQPAKCEFISEETGFGECYPCIEDLGDCTDFDCCVETTHCTFPGRICEPCHEVSGTCENFDDCCPGRALCNFDTGICESCVADHGDCSTGTCCGGDSQCIDNICDPCDRDCVDITDCCPDQRCIRRQPEDPTGHCFTV